MGKDNAEVQRRRDAEGERASAWKETDIGLLPAEWKVADLGEVAHINLGQSPPSSTYNTVGDGLPFLQGKTTFGRVFPTPERWCSAPKRIAQPGSVLISVRAPVGDVNVAREEYCIGRGLTALDAEAPLDNWFLFCLLVYAKPRLESKSTGSTFKSINKGILKSFPIPLPPLPEQRRIAPALRTIQEAIAAQEDVITAARELKRSLMERVFTYGPGPEPAQTKDTEIGEIPEHWDVVPLNKLVRSKITDGVHKTPTYVESGIPFITVTNLHDGHIDFSDCKYIPEQEHRELIQRCKPEKGDVLLSKVGTLGKTAVVDVEFGFSLFVQVALIKPEFGKMDAYCLKALLDSRSMQRQIDLRSSQSTMQYIGVGKIADLRVCKRINSRSCSIMQANP